MKTTCLLILLIAAAPAWALPVEQATLPSGMTVAVLEDRGTDLVGIHLALRVAGSQEPAEQRGVRALVQQQLGDLLRARIDADPDLLWLDTALNRPDAPPALNVEWDFVELTLAVPSERLPQTLALLAEVLFRAELPAEGLASAREGVLQQRQEASAAGIQGAFYLFRSALLGAGSGLEMIFGTSAGLGAITSEQVRDFRARYYLPANAALFLTGAVSAPEALADATQAFGSLPPGQPTAWQPALQPAEASRARVDGSADLSQAILVVGVPLPRVTEPDFASAIVALQLLAGPDGRLHHDTALVRDLGLNSPAHPSAAEAPVEALPLTVEGQPYLALWAVCSPDNIAQVSADLCAHLQALATGPITDQEFDSARLRAATELAIQLSMPQTCAAFLNRCRLFGADPAAIAALPDTVMLVTRESIADLAARHFTHTYVGVQMPQ